PSAVSETSYALAATWRLSLTFRGSALAAFRLGHGRVPRNHFALEHPDLDADDTIGGVRFGEAVIDVGTKRVQRHPPFAVPLAARDFGTVETTGDVDLDALRAQAHRVTHGTLHRAAEHNALLKLLGHTLGNQLGVELRLANLFDVDVHRHTHDPRHLGPQALDVLALLADHHTGTSRVNGHQRVLRGAFDLNFAHRGMRQLFLEEVAHAQVGVQVVAEARAVGIPHRPPLLGDTEAKTRG